MAIFTFTQGETARGDQKLFGMIGHWLVSKRVHDKLGICVSSEPGDIWLVSTEHGGKATGFLNARSHRNGHLHIRLVFADNDSELRRKVLIKRAVNMAQELGNNMAWTNERKSSSTFAALGFDMMPSGRGNFCRWELKIEDVSA